MINTVKLEWNILGFINDNQNELNGKYKTIHDDYWLENCDDEIYVVFGIGQPKSVSRLQNLFSVNSKIIYPNLIHPSASGDWDSINIGVGNIITQNCIFTCDISIGNFNIFNTRCAIGHDTKIGDFNVFNPNAQISGNVSIGDGNFFGVNSCVLQNITIGSNNTIGACSLIIRKIKDNLKYFGIPALKIQD